VQSLDAPAAAGRTTRVALMREGISPHAALTSCTRYRVRVYCYLFNDVRRFRRKEYGDLAHRACTSEST
jgi:hypothetical protein